MTDLPCNYIRSKADDERADENADLFRGSLLSPLLLCQTSLLHTESKTRLNWSLRNENEHHYGLPWGGGGVPWVNVDQEEKSLHGDDVDPLTVKSGHLQHL